MDHKQGFVVGVGSRGRPVERSCDHCAVVDHGELVVQFVASSEARGAHAADGLLEGFVVGLEFAVPIRQGHPQQIEHF